MTSPDDLRRHYSAFLKSGQILLTGHSHQAWPDVSCDGMLDYFADAARLVDDKWEAAFAVANEIRVYVARCIGASANEIALGQNTHELVIRFLSALDLKTRPHLVTTSGEFHTITRQLRRLEETNQVRVTWVEAIPVETLAARLAAAVTEQTAAVLTSTVLFETSAIVPELAALVSTARSRGAEVLLDAYHAFSVVPFSLQSLGATDAFVIAGGYKYAQWGEGTCFLRVPLRPFRPVLTGWFAQFAHLADQPPPRSSPAESKDVGYGTNGADAFAGGTYDPVSHYRARAVIRFFEGQGMTIDVLRKTSLRQTQRIIDRLAGLNIATPRADASRAGFVAVRTPRADGCVKALRSLGIFVDSRGELLRLGPAPYLTDDELDRGVAAVRQFLGQRVG